MHTRGTTSFETRSTARDRWTALEGTARTVVREIARAMSFDRDEYEERITSTVVATAREVLFASELAVTVGSRSEYEEWAAGFDGSIETMGHEAVDNVVWHAAPDAGAVAAFFQDDEDAAVETLRRQAVGRLYRPWI